MDNETNIGGGRGKYVHIHMNSNEPFMKLYYNANVGDKCRNCSSKTMPVSTEWYNFSNLVFKFCSIKSIYCSLDNKYSHSKLSYSSYTKVDRQEKGYPQDHSCRRCL